MRDRFRGFSGGIYTIPACGSPSTTGGASCGRTPDRYDVIQASLVDTWAATAAGAYTLTENTLYTVEAFNDYLDHLTDDGVLTITRWVLDGLRLISLAQAACESRGCDAASRLAIVQHDRVATFLLQEDAVHEERVVRAAAESNRVAGIPVLCTPNVDGSAPTAAENGSTGRILGDYARLILARPIATGSTTSTAATSADDRQSAVLLPLDEARRISFRSRSAGRCCSAMA